MTGKAHQSKLKIIKNFWYGFISIIYPSTCKICDNELPENINHICPLCTDDFQYTYFEKYKEPTPADEIFYGRVEIENVFSLLFFKKEGATQKILHKIKYQNEKDLAVFMGENIGRKIMGDDRFEDIDALVPIPLHSKKKFIRGFNQSLKISTGISKKIKAPIVELIKRNKHHASQTKKDKFERWDNVANIFDVNKVAFNNHKHIALVDDVLTTGSTLEAAAKTLKRYDPKIKISVITLAFVE